MRLCHFTCRDHGLPGILRDRAIRPNPAGHPMLPTWPPVVWLTDLANPTAMDVGLTSETLTCDRLAVRFVIDVDAMTFEEARRRWRIPLDTFLDLTSYGHPERWWVREAPISEALWVGYHRRVAA